MRPMEPNHPLGYHYPAGTPGPRTEYVTATCSKCARGFHGRLIYDLGTADLVLDGPGYRDDGSCPDCGQDAPPLKVERTGEPSPDDLFPY